jgi:ribosome biogenesis protein Nip4
VKTIEFRVVSTNQKGSILSRIDRVIGEGVGRSIAGDMEIVVASGKRTEVFLVPRTVLDVFEKTQIKRSPYCLGIYIGDLVKEDFLLSIEGATLCSPHTMRKVEVSDKGEQAVLYGRNITSAQVKDYSRIIHKGEKVIVVNRLKETIAVGKALVDGDKFSATPKEKVVAENILDRGWYLRKGT